MGIKYFFRWFRDSFPKTVTKYNDKLLNDKGENKPFLLLLDLNGIIHTSCQKIYKYGSFEPKTLLKKSPPVFSGEKDLLVFEDVLNSINALVATVNPEEIVLCIDGVAPVSKQIQQRQRRFLSKKTSGGFDSNCISPGTDFLYRLGLYLKTNLELKLENDWINVSTIYFMDSLVPGEGEHKLYDFLRSHQARITERNFNVVVVGNDADLIMLSLLVSTLFLKENLIYILREDLTSKKLDYLLIDVNQFKKNIFDFAVAKPSFKHYDFEYVVCDFVILCFMVGNDFLPPIPLFNIYDGGLDLMMKYYFTTPGYITYRPTGYRPCNVRGSRYPRSDPKKNKDETKPQIQINFKKFHGFFDHVFYNISPQAIQHYKTREYGYPNILLDVASKKEVLFMDIASHYLKSYSIHHGINDDLVKSYLEEVKWIFNYYAYGAATVNWRIYYPSQFAPTSLDLVNYLKNNPRHLINDADITYPNVGCPTGTTNTTRLRHTSGPKQHLYDPFFQLLCILPPHSADLLPHPFNKILREELVKFHPKDIQVDYEGKLNEWEGIPILPPLDYDIILNFYNAGVNLCSEEDLKRNTTSKQIMISVVQSTLNI